MSAYTVNISDGIKIYESTARNAPDYRLEGNGEHFTIHGISYIAMEGKYYRTAPKEISAEEFESALSKVRTVFNIA